MLVPLEPEPQCVFHSDRGSQGVSIARKDIAVPLWQCTWVAGPNVATTAVHNPVTVRQHFSGTGCVFTTHRKSHILDPGYGMQDQGKQDAKTAKKAGFGILFGVVMVQKI